MRKLHPDSVKTLNIFLKNIFIKLVLKGELVKQNKKY